jgi:hypothetical protein
VAAYEAWNLKVTAFYNDSKIYISDFNDESGSVINNVIRMKKRKKV